jgi:hypothetical protein
MSCARRPTWWSTRSLTLPAQFEHARLSSAFISAEVSDDSTIVWRYAGPSPFMKCLRTRVMSLSCSDLGVLFISSNTARAQDSDDAPQVSAVFHTTGCFKGHILFRTQRNSDSMKRRIRTVLRSPAGVKRKNLVSTSPPIWLLPSWQGRSFCRKNDSPVTTWAQFCMSRTSARSTTAISMADRKSPGAPPPSGGGSASTVVRARGDATIMSLCRKSLYSLIAPLHTCAGY